MLSSGRILSIDREKLEDMWYKMNLIRLFEERVRELFVRSRMIYGIVHISIGQEALSVGAMSCLHEEDKIIVSHRGHGHLIAKGCDINGMMAELMGKKTGLCKGKGGSMHVADFSKGVLGAQGIVGSQITLAAGSALSDKLKQKPNVTLCFFGDGAANTGSFHEGINFAACMELPVVFICENNFYAVYNPFEKTCKIENIADRATAYGIPGKTIDGNDVVEVYEETKKAIEYARKGKGPVLLEARTYRWYGHGCGDGYRLRDREEVDEWINNRDPIKLFKNCLLEEGIFSNEELNDIAAKAKMKVDDAVKYAMESPEPGPVELLDDVFFTS